MNWGNRLLGIFAGSLLLLGLGAGRTASAAAPKANLRGEVMILVYHNFGTKDGRWTRSFDSFDHDLERLDAAGYRPITLRQYASGDFQLPAGTTPVVLTFDDGSRYQFRFTADGQVDPDSAVGRWEAFARTHPEFPVHGTFFVNPGTDVFGQKAFIQQKLEMLVKMGSEIGNHTWSHPYLKKLPPAGVEREIGLGQYDIDHWLPGYPVVSFALPFGESPHPASLAAAGSWTGEPGARTAKPVTVRWDYRAVVLVGSNPAPSPLLKGVNMASLPRVQVFTPEFDHWMSYFERYPGRRFVSDGERHPAESLAPSQVVRATFRPGAHR